VVHGIIKDHHGQISVHSEPGQGTTFTVYLPMITHEQSTAPQAVLLPPMSLAHERIMVVDDDDAIRDMTCQFLTQAGYRVDVFTNGVEAWAALSQTPEAWDLLLTDQTMPGMTGDQLTAKARDLRPGLPVIICSGFSATLDDKRAKALGVKAYLQKPLGIFTLLTSVSEALHGDGLACGDGTMYGKDRDQTREN
jgi:CheY-like chemotaxis protein